MRFAKFVLLFILIIVILGVSVVVTFNRVVPKIENPISILVLGKGGEGHTAPNLTDTIMLVHLNPSSNKISAISLPRDIWITEIRAKLNTAYHYGGFKMADDSVKSVTNVEVSNNLVVDFSLFKDVINSMGGIEVDVENSFVDDKYPIAGLENDLCNGDKTYACRYETLTINQGKQKMDGETALKFVRSRNAKGDEGTDIAREKRQQRVISAIQDKVLSTEVLLNYKTLQAIYSVVVSHVETDLDNDTIFTLARFVIESRNNIKYLTIPEEFIEVSQNDKKYDKQYVFIPASGSWLEFQKWLSETL